MLFLGPRTTIPTTDINRWYAVAECITLCFVLTRQLFFRYDLLWILRRQAEQRKDREQETNNRDKYGQIALERWPMSCRGSQWKRKECKERTQGSKETYNHLHDPLPIPNQYSRENQLDTSKKEKDFPIIPCSIPSEPTRHHDGHNKTAYPTPYDGRCHIHDGEKGFIVL